MTEPKVIPFATPEMIELNWLQEARNERGR
jgi:hypothetical protein